MTIESCNMIHKVIEEKKKMIHVLIMPARERHKLEGGQGGKLGHSNMCHWVTTEEIKSECRKRRRRQGKSEIQKQVLDLKAES